MCLPRWTPPPPEEGEVQAEVRSETRMRPQNSLSFDEGLGELALMSGLTHAKSHSMHVWYPSPD